LADVPFVVIAMPPLFCPTQMMSLLPFATAIADRRSEPGARIAVNTGLSSRGSVERQSEAPPAKSVCG